MINTIGDIVNMKVTNPRHYGPSYTEPKGSDFSDVFKRNVENGLKETNDQLVNADSLVTKMITKPDSVDIHDVMIAQQKAQISLDLTRTVLSKAIQAYKEITNLR